MAIVVTTWTPDTCGCTVDFEWDSATSEDERVHTYKEHRVMCEHHGHLRGEDAYAAIVHENVTKNAVHHLATLHLPLGHTVAPVEHRFNRKLGTVELVYNVGDIGSRVAHVTASDVVDLVGRAVPSHGITLNKGLIPVHQITVR